MDFIERIFHIAPDGGSGQTELALLLAGACVAALVLCWPFVRAVLVLGIMSVIETVRHVR